MATRILTTALVLALAAGFLAAAPQGALADSPVKGLVVSATNPDPASSSFTVRTDSSTGATGQFIAGRGSTFQTPFMIAALPHFNANTGNHAAYWGCGSGCGRAGLLGTATSISPAPDCTVTTRYAGDCAALPQVQTLRALWAGSDAPLSASEKATVATQGGETLYLPLAVAAVAVTYNVPGCSDGQITLSAHQIAQIYRATDSGVTTWGQLSAGNPCLANSTLAITPVFRSDSSGTSFAFTDFLCHAGETVFCPATSSIASRVQGGSGQSGNPGVAGKVQTTPGAIGYNEIDVARSFSLSTALVVNHDGAPTPANEATARAALNTAAPQLPESNQDWSSVSIVWQPGAQSYPITSFTYAIVFGNPAQMSGNYASTWTADQYAQAAALFRFLVNDGQQYLPGGYVNLTPSVQALANRGIDRMDYGAEKTCTLGGLTTVGSTSALDQGYPVAGIAVSVSACTGGVFTPSQYAYRPSSGAASLANGEGSFVCYTGTVAIAGGAIVTDGQLVGRVATVSGIADGVYGNVCGEIANHHLLARSAQ